jgi:cyclase
LGGAGSLEDISKVIEKYKIIGVSAGSLFVFKGVYKAVLINYPSKTDKAAMIKKSNQKGL